MVYTGNIEKLLETLRSIGQGVGDAGSAIAEAPAKAVDFFTPDIMQNSDRQVTPTLSDFFGAQGEEQQTGEGPRRSDIELAGMLLGQEQQEQNMMVPEFDQSGVSGTVEDPLDKTDVLEERPQEGPLSFKTEEQITKKFDSSTGGATSEDMEGFESAIDRESEAKVRVAEQEFEKQKELAQEKQKLVQDLDESNQRFEEIKRERDDFQKQRIGELENSLIQIQNTKIDPNRLMNSKTTGDKIMTSIALFLSGFGSAMLGQENSVLKQINTEIQRDINAQIENLNNKKASVNSQFSLYKANLNAFGDQESAELASRAQILESYQAKIDQISASQPEGSKNPKLEVIRQGLEKEKLKAIIDLKERTKQQATTVITQNKTAIPNQAVKDNKLTVTTEKGSFLGMARTSKEAEEANKAIALTKEANDAINSILKVREDAGLFGFEMFNKDVVERGKTEATLLRSSMKELQGLGVLSDQDIKKFIDTLVPEDPTGFSFGMAPRLESLRDILNRRLNTDLTQKGLVKASTFQKG